MNELVPLFAGVRGIVDVTPGQGDVIRHLRMPDGIPVDALGPVDAAERADLGPETLLIGLVGPDPERHTDPDALAPLLRRLRPGAQVLLLVGWEIEKLPQHRLLGPLAGGSCQLLGAIPLDRVTGHGVHCALVLRCVDAVAPPRAYLMDLRPETDGTATAGASGPDGTTDGASEPDGAADDGWGPDGELRGLLRLVNEYVLADLVARPARRRIGDLEQRLINLERKLAERDQQLGERDRQLAERDLRLAETAEALAQTRAELERQEAELIEKVTSLAESSVSLAEREGRIASQNTRMAALRAKLATVEKSVSYQVGRMLVTGLRHPGRALTTAPGDVAQVWRTVRSRRYPAPTAKAPTPYLRVVHIALPPARLDGAQPENIGPGDVPVGGRLNDTQAKDARQRVLTLEAPGRLLVPRKLEETGLVSYEPGALACFLAAMDVAGPGAVLDIGANVGIYAALASALTDRDVVAFEPTPELVGVARSFASRNDLRYRVEPLALGAENGTAQLQLSASSDTSNSLAVGYRDTWAQIDVPVRTLDSYLEDAGLVPAVMKVDTETTEPDVLHGAAAAIAAHRPWILCEVLAGRSENELAKVLAPHGYHWYHVTQESPYRKADRIAGDPTYQYLMWLFAPEEPGAEFWAALRRRIAALAECTPDRGTELAGGGVTDSTPDRGAGLGGGVATGNDRPSARPMAG